MRYSNTSVNGSSFNQSIKDQVWEKGRIIPGYDPKIWRRDSCGDVLNYANYGQETKHGWEIDHILPVSKGGSDHISNLQPLFWETNRKKADIYPWNCSMK